MILIAPARPSVLRTLGSKLFGRKPKEAPKPILVDEHEVYLAGLWDQSTSHAPVEFTGTREECEEFIAANPRRNCLNWKQAIRPTGKLVEVS